MTLDWARLVHERLGVIATFAFSQQPLAQLRNKDFAAWRFVDKSLFAIPEVEATNAAIHFALYLRTLDDEQDLTRNWKRRNEFVGTLYLKNGKTERLSPREMTNKIIHAERIEWDFSSVAKIVCIGRDEQTWVAKPWVRAEINVIDLITLGGSLGS
jgi:hypothetical protein